MTGDPHTSNPNRSFAAREREALADALTAAGPDAPTLCEGWTTKDLATHLVVREYRPDAAAGMFFRSLERHLDKVTADYNARPYADLIDQFREGPPVWNPMRLVDSGVNLLENFVHHEDVLRGAAVVGEEWRRREVTVEDADQLWKAVPSVARMFLRKCPVNVELIREEAVGQAAAEPRCLIKAAKPKQSSVGAAEADTVRVIGPATEILLWLYSRDKAADLTFDESAPGVLEKVQRSAI